MAADHEVLSRKRAFHAFHERVGLKPFSPEFTDSLYHTMRLPHDRICLSEQVWAWCRWRAWGNSSESCVSSWDGSAEYLDQTDCALDLWWFQTGKSAEYIEGAPAEVRRAERQTPAVRAMKYRVSRAFAKVEDRGHIQFEGQRIVALISPQVVESSLKVAGTATFFEADRPFLAWWQVAEPAEYSEWEVARDRYFSARKVARDRNREFRKSQLSDPPVLIEVMSLSNERNKDSRSVGKEGSRNGTDRPTDTPSASPEPEEPPPTDRLTGIRKAIPRELIARWREPLSHSLLSRVHSALGNDVPTEHLTERIRLRWDAIEKPGFLINLARDVREAWEQTQTPARPAANGNGTAQEHQSKEQFQRDKLIEWYQSAVKDQSLPPEERADLQKDLDALLACTP